jgi:hypothetical protein
VEALVKPITDAERIDFIVRHVEHWYNVPNRASIIDPERQAKQQCFLCVTPYKRQPNNPDLRMLLLRVLDDSIRVDRGEEPQGYTPPFKMMTAKGFLLFRYATIAVILSVPTLVVAWLMGGLS